MEDRLESCSTAALPGEVNENVQQNHQRQQESAHAPGKANLREFATEEGDLGIGGNVAQQQHAHAVVNDPCYKDNGQVDGANIHDNRPKEAGELEGCTVVHEGEGFVFRLAVFTNHVGLAATENESENEGLNGTEHHQQEATAPEVEFIDCAGSKAKDSHEAAQERHDTRSGYGALPVNLQVIFAEADQWLDNRDSAGDACDKEHGEPECLEEAAEGQLAEHERHGLEAQAEGSELGAFFDVVAGNEHGHRNHDGTAQNDFGKAVGGACGQGRKHQVFFGFQVASVAENDTHTETHGEEHLARGGKPHGGVKDFRKVRVPNEGKALADIANGKHANHKDNAHDQENRHGHLVHAFNALTHAERE